MQRFTEHGVDPARITLEPGAPHYDYLAAYSRVDATAFARELESTYRRLAGSSHR